MFEDFLSAVEVMLTWLIDMRVRPALLAAVVLASTWMLGSWLQPRWRFALWLVVLARLAMPVIPVAPGACFRLCRLAQRHRTVIRRFFTRSSRG